MTRQIIYWHHQAPGFKGKKPKRGEMAGATVHMIVGYTKNRLSDFMEMALKMKKTFEPLKIDDVICTTVSRSNYCSRHTVTEWIGTIKFRKYKGWDTGNINSTGYDLAA